MVWMADDTDGLPGNTRCPLVSPVAWENAMNAFSASLSEPYTIVGSCIDCTTPANLLATFALLLIGATLAVGFERKRLPRGPADPA
jgi:hypothetical protein